MSSLIPLARVLCALAFALLPLRAHAQSISLKPYKDELFAYPATLVSTGGGAYRAVDYREARDIDARDEVPERRVHAKYVGLGVRREQQDLSIAGVAHFAVGSTDGARFIVVYLHGQGGSRKQGVDDFTFGGNFNRLKNLAVQNGGLYLSPDFPDFDAGGAAAVAALIDAYAARSPQARIVVACGSMGGGLCFRLAGNAGLAPRLGGILLLGSHWDEGFVQSPAFKAKTPLFIGHGSRDKVFAVEKQEAFFRAVEAASPAYPVRFVRFEGGTHGTPIRMTDWRETLNWMFSLP